MRNARIERRIDQWSRGISPLHRRHAAAKILATLAVLVSIATLAPKASPAWLADLLILLAAVTMARLPLLPMLRAATVVLPFALCFVALSAIGGEPARGLWFMVRAYLSAMGALWLVATTPMHELLAGLEWLRAPRFLVQVMQFLWRYLIVLLNEARFMRQAMLARGCSIAHLRFRQSAAAAGSLFARSYARAQAVHFAMIARGFEGHLARSVEARFQWADAGLLSAAIILVAAVRAVFQ